MSTTPRQPVVKQAKPVNRSRVRPVGACAGCHEEKQLQAKGLCSKCYMAVRRSGLVQLGRLTHAVEVMEAHLSAADEARRFLVAGLPTASKLLAKAAEVAAEKGDHRPAQVWLEGVSYDDTRPTARVLAGPVKSEGPKASTGVQVLINIPLGGRH